MILLSVGTHEQPFERAVDVVAPLAISEPVLVQHGFTPPRPGSEGVEWRRFLDLPALRDAIARASVVFCHAGVGSILLVLQAAKVPVVIPRLARFGEHVDDHQLEIATSLADRGLVVPCGEGADVQGAIAEAKACSGRGIAAGRRLQAAVAREADAGRRGTRA